MTGKHILAIIAVVAMVTTLVIPAQQIVICKDGRRLAGEVTKTKDGYRIRMKGGTVTIANERVLKIEDAITEKDELTKRLAEIDPRDANGYYQVARWAYEQNMPVKAQEILGKVLKIKPDHERALMLLRLVKIRLTGSNGTTTTTATTKSGKIKPLLLDSSNFLTEEDIYRIRMMELKSDDKVSIRYRNDVLNRFVKLMEGIGDFEERGFEKTFRGYSKVKQVLYIVEWTDRENTSIRDDILVRSDPKVIKEFRTRIWPIIARSFAKPSCYGGVKGRDGLKLFNLSLTDRVAYTNFYILHKWQRGGRRMINRDSPELSLLLQYGLPKKLAKCPMPDYIHKPIFTSKDDRNYKLISEWIKSLRRLFPPGYQIDYRLPGTKTVKPKPPTTKPVEK